MTLGMMTADGPAQVNAKPIDAFQAWLTQDESQQTLWPGHIRLTEKFFDSLMEHAVPLQPEAIGRLQNSALDLDAYSWLAHRLWRVNDPAGVMVSWAALKQQFGQEYADTKNFRRKFLGALGKATDAYKEARIELDPRGLKLLPSPPPVRRPVVALPCPEPPAGRPGGPATGEAETPAPARVLVPQWALEKVREIAPGWDKYGLEERYTQWVKRLNEAPRDPGRAFLGWVRKFTKGKAP
jgi:hypothetical protein